MEPLDVYSHISQNNRRIWGLILFFPISLLAFVYGVFAFLCLFEDRPFVEAIQDVNEVCITFMPAILGICLVLTLLSFWRGDKMMLGFSGAEVCPNDKEHLQIYRAVENLALKAGVPTPKVYVIPDDSLNAFATGYSPKSASIALTRGIINRLEPIELDAVISHEMAHIINRDIRLNLFVVTGIGIIGMAGDFLIRMRSSNSNSNNRNGGSGVFVLIGLCLLLFSYLIAPFIRMALSRTQEFQADAVGSYLTRHPGALANALKKISVDPRVESLDTSPQMAGVCIYNPLKHIGGLLDSHPPIAERVKRLNKMVGMFGEK